MKELGYVCLRCRVGLLAASRTRASCQPTLSSNRYTTAAAPDTPSRHDASEPARPNDSALPPTLRAKREAKPQSMVATRARRGNGTSADGSSSMAVFNSVVNSPKKIPAPANPDPSAESPTASSWLVKDVAKLQDMIERHGRTATDSFTFFEQLIYPQLVEAGDSVPAFVVNQLDNIFMRRLCLEKIQNLEPAKLPTVTRISEILLQLGILRPPVWSSLMLSLLQRICQLSTSPTEYTSIQAYETAMAQRDVLLQDLTGAWAPFLSLRTSDPSLGDQAQPDPSLLHAAKPRYQPLQKKVAALYPQFSWQNMLNPTLVVLATHLLLTEPVSQTRSIGEQASQFTQIMSGPLTESRPPVVRDFKYTLERYPELCKYLESRLVDHNKSHTSSKSISTWKSGSPDIITNVQHQLELAVRARNLEDMKKAWENFWGDEDVPDAARAAELAKHPKTFDHFILAFMGIRQSALAITVWDRIQKIGVKPTIRTWTAMIQGCANARKPDGIKTVWDRLVKSGVKLDTTAWTARISGLIVSGDPDGGIRALDEMAQRWRDRADPSNASLAVQPTIEPVNAALVNLLRLERLASARKVLTWAAKQSISPDIYTFNTMLRSIIRSGQTDEIAGVFAMMKAANIEADAATLTILLDDALANVGAQTPAQQVAIVTKIIADMRATGVHANMKMYAKMIYVLLQAGDATADAVKAVLAHIWGSGLELTSHIYTMLAEHYFARDPPDADAVTSLIDGRRLADNKSIDRIFWERVIRGYCYAGETDRAREIFDRNFRTGTAITFSTLHDLLQALLEAGQMQAAAELVVTAREIKEVDDHGREGKVQPRFWKHRFWHLANRHGLLGDELRAYAATL
ncbi:hypothetical protein B0T19DRAFT_415703 [Cercophora scortea]|uniref:Pentatricopeptide repeat-containing protein n=1 Tax=Cercophora scortea TaxID=314031 RepID=A0AAE0MIM5_9PEZI|nr:hypothetical protein B0T19DRAFT_415703 [Cercophora scortea]